MLPILIFSILLVCAGILAITQESDEPEDIQESEDFNYDFLSDGGDDYYLDDMDEPLWMPPGPPRWYRSNAGGMIIEEIPSRLAALRNRYALVIDYISPEEIDPLLLPFFRDEYTVEIRVLYEDGMESRRQWVFIDEAGAARLNAVFRDIDPGTFDDTNESIIESENGGENPDVNDNEEHGSITRVIDGFIEIFNENSRIMEDHLFLDDGTRILTRYFYDIGFLTRSETQRSDPDGSNGEYLLMHTDYFRYNRSFSLRSVERMFHGPAVIEPMRQTFPYLVLDAAANMDFLEEKLSFTPDFFGDLSADEGFRLIYDTDSRGRILAQTLIDSEGEVVWVITNTWLGDRILSIQRVEGDNVMSTEYEYNSAGDRIMQRDMQNGILERQIYIDGKNETEELFMDGMIVMRAYWEDGMKISEERVRR